MYSLTFQNIFLFQIIKVIDFVIWSFKPFRLIKLFFYNLLYITFSKKKKSVTFAVLSFQLWNATYAVFIADSVSDLFISGTEPRTSPVAGFATKLNHWVIEQVYHIARWGLMLLMSKIGNNRKQNTTQLCRLFSLSYGSWSISNFTSTGNGSYELIILFSNVFVKHSNKRTGPYRIEYWTRMSGT